MKRVLYSNVTKLIAFVLCAVFMASCAYLLSASVVQNRNSIYLFETSYERSYMAQEELRNTINMLYRASTAVTENDYAYSESAEYAVEENASERTNPTPTPLTAEQRAEISRQRDESMKRAVDLLDRAGWEYYVEYNGKTYANTDDKSFEAFENDSLAAGEKRIKTGANDGSYASFSNPGRVDNYGVHSEFNNFTACVRMSEKMAADNRAVWETAKAAGDAAAKKIIAMLIALIVLVSYLFTVSGRDARDKEIHLMLFDRAFTEIPLILIAAPAIICVMLNLAIMDEIVFVQGIAAGNMLIFAVTFAFTAVILAMMLSVIRNMKNRTFLKRSLIVCVILWAWKWVKAIFNLMWRILIRIRDGIRALFGRRSGMIMAVLLIVYTVFAAINPIIAVIMIAIGCLFLGVRTYDFDKIKAGVSEFKKGNFAHKIEYCRSEDYKAVANDLNEIGEGMAAAVEERVKAERMKSELITNVSHDLKTPLTSIINYADLLSKEQLTPAEANDYVKIIQKKGERLKQLTNDLFEISKVQSGNEDFVIEDIDLCLLVEQAMAELNEAIKNSGLNFIVKASDKEVIVKADGKKMSRVFENLFINCVKYAMKNTRVYVDIIETDSETVVEIKNIAGYEMNFDEDEIAERFVRGDSARTSEGSGLGLAIVKSYVEGCGGRFEIKKDGDLFKARIVFE